MVLVETSFELTLSFTTQWLRPASPLSFTAYLKLVADEVQQKKRQPHMWLLLSTM
jgi:hypothetical protein